MNWVPNRWQRAILFLTTLGFVSMFFRELLRYGSPRIFEGSLVLVGAACAACLAFHNVGKK